MQRYFIYLSYDGTSYHGWQVQPNGNSVQEELQRALSTLLREKKEVVGAGRTDAGVHARVMVAHFEHDASVNCPQLAYKLNRLLPRDISVMKVIPVDADMHARFSATKRTYHYYIHTRKDPFHRFFSCETHYDLDMVSFGPTLRFVHTPEERIHIPTVDMVWRHLLDVLKNIPSK